jgi:hypothetical protein
MTQHPFSDKTLSQAIEQIGKDAARYRFMRENIDYTDDREDGTGYYWHNQRGEFSYVISGGRKPSFEEVIDAAITATKESP